MLITLFYTGLAHITNSITVTGFNPASPVFIELTIKKTIFFFFSSMIREYLPRIRGQLNNKAVYSQEKHAVNRPVLNLLAAITISYHYLVAILASDILNSYNNFI